MSTSYWLAPVTPLHRQVMFEPEQAGGSRGAGTLHDPATGVGVAAIGVGVLVLVGVPAIGVGVLVLVGVGAAGVGVLVGVGVGPATVRVDESLQTPDDPPTVTCALIVDDPDALPVAPTV